MKYASLDTAIRITAQAFEGGFDKGGAPYILHCLFVMNEVRHLGYKAMMIGVMHDLIEDTDCDEKMLLSLGFHPDVVVGVSAMTHQPGVDYEVYISCMPTRIIPIKLADLRHNMQPQRLKDVRPKDFERLVKYAKAYKFLEDKLNARY